MDGWRNFSCFCQDIPQVLKQNTISFPVLLYLDGNSSHLTYEVASICAENQIILYCLPAHSSHAMQPLDVGFFGPMKALWFRHLQKWHMDNPGRPFVKGNFPAVIKAVWEESKSVEKAKKGFLRSGLMPLNPSAVNLSRLVMGQQTENSIQPADADIEFSSMSAPPHHPDLSPLSSSPLDEVTGMDCSAVQFPTAMLTTEQNSFFDMSGMSGITTMDQSYDYPSTEAMDCRVVYTRNDGQGHSSSVTQLSQLPIDYSCPSIVAITRLPEEENSEIEVCEKSNPHSFQPSLTSTPVSQSEPTPSTSKEKISNAFDILQVPISAKTKKRISILPKATTGAEALEILRERDLKKKQVEVDKIKRKVMRQKKKQEKDAERNKKGKEKLARLTRI